MKMFLLIPVLFVLCGCKTSSPSTGLHLSRAEATHIAVKAAAKHGINFRDYDEPDANYRSVGYYSQTGEWDVIWAGLHSDEGFEVVIDDKKRKVVHAEKVRIATLNTNGTLQAPPNTAPEPTPTAP